MAATLADLLHEPAIGRQVFEAKEGRSSAPFARILASIEHLDARKENL